MEQSPKQGALNKFHSANSEEIRNEALNEHEDISYYQVVNASTAEELQTLYNEAMVNSPSRALALEKLAREKGWDIKK